MNKPLYSYQAIETLALMDTGHFVYLDAWSISALLSILTTAMPLYNWQNTQFPLTPAETADLERKLAQTGGDLMKTMVGLIMPICTNVIPDGTLLCDGSTHNRADYPNLYDALDPYYHMSPDSFSVPDLRGKFVLGPDTSHPVNSDGGSFEHVQTLSELASHTHTSPPHTHTEITAIGTVVSIGLEPPVPAALPSAGITGASIVTIDSAGSSAPMDITPPFVALRYVVVAL